MANRAENRYALPECCGENRDITEWVANLPFFLGSAVKYIYRGWNDVEDLKKALDCIEKCRINIYSSKFYKDMPTIGNFKILVKDSEIRN